MISTVSLPERFREGRKTFFWALKTERGLLGINLVACLLLFPMMTAMQLSHVRDGVHGSTIDFYKYNISSALQAQGTVAALLELLMILILIGTLFSYMHDRRALDLLHAMPVGRVPMLLGRWGASLVVVLLPLLIGCASNEIVVAANGLQAQVGGTFLVFLKLALPLFAALSFSIFICVCCGNTFNTILSIIIINICWPMLFWLGSGFLRNILPGFVDSTYFSSFDQISGNLLYTLLSPGSAAITVMCYRQVLHISYAIWWFAFGVLVLVAAAVLYQRRKSESAENSFAFAAPKLVIQFLVSTATALLGGMVFANTYKDMCLFGLILGGVLAFVLLEIIYSRGFQSMKKMLPALGVFVGVGVIAILCVSFDVFGFVTRVPQAADISYVEVNGFGRQYYVTNKKIVNNQQIEDNHYIPSKIYKADEIQQLVEAHKAITEGFSSGHKPYTYGLLNNAGCGFGFTYHLKNGKTLTRSYSTGSIPQTSNSYLKILGLSGVKDSVYAVNLLEPEDIKAVSVEGQKQTPQKSLSVSEALELQKAIRADEDVLKPYMNLYYGGEMKEVKSRIILVIEQNITPNPDSELAKALDTTEPVSFDSLDYPLPKEAVHIRAFLKEKGILK